MILNMKPYIYECYKLIMQVQVSGVRSSIVIEVIRTVCFFFMKDILNVKKTQKHLSNIQPDISKQKKAPK